MNYKSVNLHSYTREALDLHYCHFKESDITILSATALRVRNSPIPVGTSYNNESFFIPLTVSIRELKDLTEYSKEFYHLLLYLESQGISHILISMTGDVIPGLPTYEGDLLHTYTEKD